MIRPSPPPFLLHFASHHSYCFLLAFEANLYILHSCTNALSPVKNWQFYDHSSIPHTLHISISPSDLHFPDTRYSTFGFTHAQLAGGAYLPTSAHSLRSAWHVYITHAHSLLAAMFFLLSHIYLRIFSSYLPPSAHSLRLYANIYRPS
jgi:hypothetical protein